MVSIVLDKLSADGVEPSACTEKAGVWEHIVGGTTTLNLCLIRRFREECHDW